MDQFLLLVRQMKASVESVEQQLSCLYDPDCPMEHKQVVLQWAYVQARTLEDLLNAYCRQLRRFDGLLR